MDIKEIARKWHCSERWLVERCKEKMIPLAEKEHGRWTIPEDADKPPCTRNRAVLLLASVYQTQNGKEVNIFPGNKQVCIESYKYLSNWGFISSVDYLNELELKQAKITEKGLELMRDEKEKNIKSSALKGIKLISTITPFGPSISLELEYSCSRIERN